MATTINPKNKPKAVSRTQAVDSAINSVLFSYSNVEKSFITIACNLKFLQSDDNYKKSSSIANASAPSFSAFARSAFGFKKSQAYALCGLIDRFGVKNDDGTYYINHDYDTYSQTQLIAMAKLSDEQIRANIKPSMSVSDIKKKVKELCPAPPKEKKESSDITASNGANVVNTTSCNSQALKCYRNFDDFNADIKNIVAMVATVFKKNPNYRITVNYEWTPRAVSNADSSADSSAESNADASPMNPPVTDSDGNTQPQ